MSPDDAQVADRLRRALGGRALQPYPDELPADGRIDAAVLVPLRLHPHPSITVVVRSPSLADHPWPSELEALLKALLREVWRTPGRCRERWELQGNC